MFDFLIYIYIYTILNHVLHVEMIKIQETTPLVVKTKSQVGPIDIGDCKEINICGVYYRISFTKVVRFCLYSLSLAAFVAPWAEYTGTVVIHENCTVYKGAVVTLWNGICGEDLSEYTNTGNNWMMLRYANTINLIATLVSFLLTLFLKNSASNSDKKVLNIVTDLVMAIITSFTVVGFNKFQFIGEEHVSRITGYVISSLTFTFYVLSLVWFCSIWGWEKYH